MTTIEQALTVDCPECGRRAGEMCVVLTAPHVPGVSGPYRGSGTNDKAQIGRVANRPHNQRLNAHYRKHLPPAEHVLTWRGRRSGDDRYQIDIGELYTFVGQRKRLYEAHVRVYGLKQVWFTIGTEFKTLDEAKAACQADNVSRDFARCSCFPGHGTGHTELCPVPGSLT